MMRRDQPTNAPPAGANDTFAVTQVRLDNGGRIADVWWNRVDAASHRAAGGSTTTPVSAVVCAIRAGTSVISCQSGSDDEARDRRYVVADLPDGQPTIVLEVAGPRRGIAGSAVLVGRENVRHGTGWTGRSVHLEGRR